MKVRKSDNVLVIAGNYVGKNGKVLKVFREKARVIVEGVNIVKRHTRASQKNPQGGILQKEGAIHASNVMVIDPKTNEATRVGYKYVTDVTTGRKKKMRISRRTNEMF